MFEDFFAIVSNLEFLWEETMFYVFSA
jgi:hypothetical protein